MCAKTGVDRDLGREVSGSAPGEASVESVQSNWCRLVGGIMLADADYCLLGLGSGIGLNSVVKLLGGRGAFLMVSSGWWHHVGRC